MTYNDVTAYITLTKDLLQKEKNTHQKSGNDI